MRRALAAIGAAASLRFARLGNARAADLWDVRSATSGWRVDSWHGGDASGWQNAIDVGAPYGEWCGIFPYKAFSGEMGWAECWAVQTACDYPANPTHRRMRFHTFTPIDQIYGGVLWSHVEPWIGPGWTGTPDWVANVGPCYSPVSGCISAAHLHENANGNRVGPDAYSYANATVYWNWWV
jgi:hypothetical protein